MPLALAQAIYGFEISCLPAYLLNERSFETFLFSHG